MYRIFASQILPTQSCTMSVKLSLTPVRQFDQAGLMVYVDSEHWIKTGIEVVDGKPRLSCVVTNEFSDWSTQPWEALDLEIRVSQFGNGSYVVEAKMSGNGAVEDIWSFIRISHLRISKKDQLIHFGVFGCCPEKQDGCEIKFSEFNIVDGVTFDHKSV
uniref:DUF1349 domain-containing protein n=1 Tax=Aplanochytrium stocchinoi TaxID=215587 RepID=A0A7S3V3N5_9STRA